MTPSQAAIHRASKRGSRTITAINIWPLLVIQMALLCVSLGLPFNAIPRHGVTIDRPKSKNASPHPAALSKDALHIWISRDGHFFFQNTAVAIEDLASQLSLAINRGTEKTIYLEADSRYRFSDVEAVINQIRAVGVDRLVIITEGYAR